MKPGRLFDASKLYADIVRRRASLGEQAGDTKDREKQSLTSHSETVGSDRNSHFGQIRFSISQSAILWFCEPRSSSRSRFRPGKTGISHGSQSQSVYSRIAGDAGNWRPATWPPKALIWPRLARIADS